MDAASDLARAYDGEGPLYQAILEARTRELAAAGGEGGGPPQDGAAVLILRGQSGHWALPLAEVARVDPVPKLIPVPSRPPFLLGLGLMAGRRCLLADLEALAAGTPARPRDRPGHAVQLRDTALAVVADMAEMVTWAAVPKAPPPMVLADGAVWLNRAWVTARMKGNGP